jgi:hydroxyacylglutathione hydrolase
MLKVQVIKVGAYQTNAMLVWCDQTMQAIVFDPGAEAQLIMREIESQGLQPVYLINTHGHLDHIGHNKAIKEKYHVPLLIHTLDRPMLTDPALNISLFTEEIVISPDADDVIAEGHMIKVGNEELKVLHVPGHSPGSCAFYSNGILVAGDTLFSRGVGRSDLPGGDENTLLDSIRNKIYTLPPETVVYPGHGATTTVGTEQESNPFIRL